MGILIKNGMVVNPKQSELKDIRISGEKIIEIGKNLEGKGDTIIDATGKIIYPGFIDAHTHFEIDTGSALSPDTFETGTKAAIVGGTTTIVDFATQDKLQTLTKALDNWHEKADDKCSCDYAFHMAITDWNEKVVEEIQTMRDRGVTSFKLYMAYDSLRVNDGEIYEILKAVKEIGGIIGVHCENGDLVNTLIKEQKALGHMSPQAHPFSRPNDVESEAVSRYIEIAKLAKCPIHIVHLSTKEGLLEVRRGRNEGMTIYVETCPQYLLMDDCKYSLPDFESAKYMLSPPLRKPEDRDMLWQGIQQGEINTISTDHCGFNFKGQKDLGKDDFSKIPNGIPGAQYRASLMYTYGVATGKISNEELVALLSENTAKLFGMYPRKGVLQEGSDADIVIWDPSYEGVITQESHLHNVDYTPFEGIAVKGFAQHVFLRGEHVVSEGQVIKTKCGSYIARDKSIL
ncbi:MAG: dihydropyrimidinase [Cellulosilyticaceae bacterium]